MINTSSLVALYSVNSLAERIYYLEKNLKAFPGMQPIWRQFSWSNGHGAPCVCVRGRSSALRTEHRALCTFSQQRRAEVALGPVGKHGGDGPVDLAAEPARGPDIGPRGNAHQEAQVAAELPGGFDRVLIAHLDHLVHHLHVQNRRDEAVADALDLVQARLGAQGGRAPCSPQPPPA